MGAKVYEWIHPDPSVNTSFIAARAFTLPRDPLVLDLDGDGLELSPASGNVLFDHDADGIKTGTGWAGADDGLLVRDLNGNGLIDSGRELFGDSTLKRNGQLARHGFDALADLDSNADGQITSADAAWSELQVWRDLNQDGISQRNELSSLNALNISRIGAVGSNTGPQAGAVIQNNRVALSTSYTRAGVNRNVGAIDLDANPFFSDIPAEHLDEEGQAVTLTDAAQALPQMNGSGMVRNLRAAMSQSGAAADELEAAVAAFSSATSREAQLAQLDRVITEWAQTSSYWSELETTLGGPVTVNPPAGMSKAEYRNLIAVLEVFNGSRFYGAAGGARPWGQSSSVVQGETQHTITPPAQQSAILLQAYVALKQSVYGALALQTRLKPYLDSIELVIDEGGLSFDTTALGQRLHEAYATDAVNAALDLADLYRYASEPLVQAGFDALPLLVEWVDAMPATSAVVAEIRGMFSNGFYLGSNASEVITGTEGKDVIYGNGGDDVIQGGGGVDFLNGGAGNDNLSGWGTFEGGTGDDAMGSTYPYSGDTYIFNLGDGRDTITDYGYSSYSHGLTPAVHDDTLRFGAGIAPADVQLQRSGNDMVFKISETDQVTVKNWFNQNGTLYFIEKLQFADGTQWGLAELMAKTPQAFNATEGGERIDGWEGVDVINGLGGNDTIHGGGGHDQIDAGEGHDAVNAGAGDDVVFGGLGNDTLEGGLGNDWIDGGDGDDLITDADGLNTMRGGAGNDTLRGRGTFEGGTGDDAMGNTYPYSGDTYIFNLGDGRDTITDYGYSSYSHGLTPAVHDDTLRFGAGIAPADVKLQRSGNDMVFKISETDQVTVKNWFNQNGALYFIEKLQFADGTQWGLSQLMAKMPQAYNATDGAERIEGWEGIDVINGLGGNDTIVGWGGNDQIDGGEGNDAINAGAGEDVVFGGLGNDTLEGGSGNDWIDGGDGDDVITDTDGRNTLRGGAGNDTLSGWGTFEGGTGDDAMGNTYPYSGDTYIFNLGDGRDTITDYGYSSYSHGLTPAVHDDTLRFGAGIAPADVKLQRSGNDMVFKISETDQVTVKNWFNQNGALYFIEKLQFADGTQWGLGQLMAKMPQAFNATDGAERIDGWEGIDVINGMGGNDAIHGGGGNDQIDGGEGNDAVNAGAGDDVVFGGLGNDTLEGGVGNDWIDGGDGDDLITDADGRNTLLGGAGNDNLSGWGTFEGGTGDDVMGNTYPYSGDTYIFNLGDGRDTITDYGYSSYSHGLTPAVYDDTLRFGAGIAPADVTLQRSGNDMVFKISETDQVTVKNWFNQNGALYYIEKLQFADGTQWGLAELMAKTPQAFNATESAERIDGWEGVDVIHGMGGNDTIVAWGGNDQIDAGEGHDAVNAGAGDDVVFGGLGNDSLEGGLGNDWIDGGDGDDLITDADGLNTMRGGAGNDTLRGRGTFEGGTGDDAMGNTYPYSGDTYIFNLGDGRDTITDYGYSSYSHGLTPAVYDDTLRFGAGIAPADVTLQRSGNDMVFKISETDQVTVKNWFNQNGTLYYIEKLQFSDGTRWEMAQLKGSTDQVTVQSYFESDGASAQGRTVDAIRFDDGTSWNYGQVKTLVQQGTTPPAARTAFGHMTAQAMAPGALAAALPLGRAQTLPLTDLGNAPDPVRTTQASGFEPLAAAPVTTPDPTAAHTDQVLADLALISRRGRSLTDTLLQMENVRVDELWFQQDANNLKVNITGTDDKATIANGYAGDPYKVEQFQTTNQVLLASQIDALVHAMAAFSPPPPGQTTLTPALQSAQAPVIAANWT